MEFRGVLFRSDRERQSESQFVQQRQRPHRHAHCLGRIFDNGGRNALLQHRAAFVYKRLEYATGVEPTAVVNNARGLGPLGDVIERLCPRLFSSLLAHGDFPQPPTISWREEMDAEKL